MIGIVKWDGTKGWTSLKVYEKKVLELKRKAKARLDTKESTTKLLNSNKNDLDLKFPPY